MKTFEKILDYLLVTLGFLAVMVVVGMIIYFVA